MELKNCKWFEPNEGDCRDVTVGALLFELFIKTLGIPSDLADLVGYVMLMVISWYALSSAFWFLQSVGKLAFMVLATVCVFRYLSSGHERRAQG